MIPSASASSTDPLLAGLPVPAATSAGDATAADFSQVFGQLAPDPGVKPAEAATAPVPQSLTSVLTAVDAGAGMPEAPGVRETEGGGMDGDTTLCGGEGMPAVAGGAGAGSFCGELAAGTVRSPTAGRPVAARSALVHLKAIGRTEQCAAGAASETSNGRGATFLPGAQAAEAIAMGSPPTEMSPDSEGFGRRSAEVASGVALLPGPISYLVGQPVGRELVEVSAGDSSSAGSNAGLQLGKGAAPVSAWTMTGAGESATLTSAKCASGYVMGGEIGLPTQSDQTGGRDSSAAVLGMDSALAGRRMADAARAWPALAMQSVAATGLPESGSSLPVAAPVPAAGTSDRTMSLPATLPTSGGGADASASALALEMTPDLAIESAAIPLAAAASDTRAEGRGAKISSRRLSLTERGDASRAFSLKTAEELVGQQGEKQLAIAGIGSAKADPIMPFPPPELVVPTAFVTTATHRSTGDFEGLESTRHPDLGTQAARAVEAVCTAAELAQRDGRSSLTLRFAMGEADLAVRVEVRDHEVRATFSTESAELRHALSHECAAAAESASRSFRLTTQISDQNGAAAGGTPFSTDSGFARREPHHPPQNPELARLASHSRATHDEPHAMAAAPLAAAFPGQSQHLHTLA